jgi:chromosome segregation protein
LYIRELELKNFKSFGRSVRIPLPNDFVTVTGPNGCGKSNIVDALLFALCLSNSRAMRAERLPDLIYKGEDGKNPEFAQVTVKLDNSCRTMPLEGDVVDISRKIKVREGKYSSSYYFNGKSLGQGELQDKLSKAGITPEGYNIVMQGDVTRIIEMTPVERRKIVDEIAGVAEFDEKKRRSLEELEVVRERIGRVDVILEEVGAQLSQLKEERDKALAHQAHREEMKRQEAFLLLARLKEASLELSRLEEDCGSLKAKEVELQKSLETKKSLLASQESHLQSLGLEITHKGEEEQIQVKRHIEELLGQIARETSRRESADRSLKAADEQIQDCFLQTASLEAELEQLAGKMRDSGLRGASLRGELAEKTEELSIAKRKIAEADIKYSVLRDELGKARGLWEELKVQQADLIRERDRLLDAARRRTLEKEELSIAAAEASESLASIDHEMGVLKSELAAFNSQAMDLEKDREDLEGARLRIKREIAEIAREMQGLQGDYAKADARLRAAEDRSGFSRAVEATRSAIKRQLLKGLYGTVAELGNVSAKFSAALESAAGARLQSIVAKTDEDAAQAIDYLKRSQIGRATFLPLNKLEKRDLPKKPKDAGVVDYALNLVSFDSKFSAAFWYTFRDTLVVETLTDARKLMGKYRMVTLDGDLVERSGAMTGGHFKSRMKFADEESKKLLELSDRISALDGERKDKLEKLDEIEEEISRISREVEELNKLISKKTFRLEEIQSGRPRFEKFSAERTERLEGIEQEAEDQKSGLDRLEKDIKETADALAEQQQKVEAALDELEGSEIPELTRQADSAEAEIKRLSERLREVEGETLKDSIKEEGAANRLRELLGRREALEAQKTEGGEERDSATQRLLELEELLKTAKDREAALDLELQGLKGSRGELLEQILVLQREVDRMERDLDRVEDRLSVSTKALESVKSTAENLRVEIESSGVDPEQEPPNSQIVAQKIKELEEAMLNLEPVNMLAIQDYDRVKARQEFLLERQETLSRERESIIDKLNKYDQMKREAFLAAFSEIDKFFKQIFKELSNGDGNLVLEDPQDPLSAGMTIKARPAGKAFHRLEAMSGGEKSLTALSFIFALQMHKPAPFYAMDEIDMYLDGVNVEKVARLIKKISKDAQFLVVSLRKPMIQQSRYTIGVTMQEDNTSSATGITTA